MDKVADYLLGKGDIGLLLLVVSFVAWLLWKQQANLVKIVEANTASNVNTAHAIDRMANELGTQVKQNSEFQRSVLESFSKSINHRK